MGFKDCLKKSSIVHLSWESCAWSLTTNHVVFPFKKNTRNAALKDKMGGRKIHNSMPAISDQTFNCGRCDHTCSYRPYQSRTCLHLAWTVSLTKPSHEYIHKNANAHTHTHIYISLTWLKKPRFLKEHREKTLQANSSFTLSYIWIYFSE